MKDNSKLFAKLKELNELKEQNLISAELYEQKRKEILGKIHYSPNSVPGDESNKSTYGWVITLCVITVIAILVIVGITHLYWFFNR